MLIQELIGKLRMAVGEGEFDHRLIDVLKNADNETLGQVVEARIKFFSPLAYDQLVSREIA